MSVKEYAECFLFITFQLLGALGARFHRVVYRFGEAVLSELVERRDRRTALGADLLNQHVGGITAFSEHRGGAFERCADQVHRLVIIDALLGGIVRHRFGKEINICGTAAVDRDDLVHVILGDILANTAARKHAVDDFLIFLCDIVRGTKRAGAFF